MSKSFRLPMRVPAKYLKITAIVLIVLLIFAAIGALIAYNKREYILRTTLEKAIRKAKTEYQLNVKIGSARFAGLRTVVFDRISVVPDNRDSLARIETLRVGVKLLPLLFGNVKLAELTMHNTRISLVKKDSLRNYDFLFRKKQDTTQKKTKVNLAELADNLLNKLLNKIPDDMDIRNFELLIIDNSEKLKLYTTSATITNGRLNSSILVNDRESTWHIQGSVDPGDKQFDVRLFAEGKKTELPFIERKYKLKLNFDTAYVRMNKVSHAGNELKISANWAVKNLLINHPKIAANDIVVPDGSIDADMAIGENYVAVDSSSVIHLKNVQANPYIKYTLSPKKIYELKLHTGEFDAQQLFNAFPQGLFESLEGMKVAGKLQYDLNFYLDTAHPDNVQFDSRLNKKDFRVLSWGKTNLQKINSTFVYTPYEYGKPMRNITIGPENPNFTPINEISPDLKNALLTAEDPSFFSHHGFVEESIRKSIATNFKEKAFKRGGSTISMQLVKNVYLNRQKTLARKIEEMLIVWIIENSHISSKERMFETYLNLIEWGRNVYGIGEASRYYFNKHPSELNLGESIFLASIVPRPKKALYFFEPDGSLRTSLRGYFKLIGNLMAKKGLTARDTNAYGFYSVRLKESLRQQLAPADSAVADTTLMIDEDEDSQTFLERIFQGKNEKKAADTVRANDGARNRSMPRDTVKTPAQLRQERREQRRRERRQNRTTGYKALVSHNQLQAPASCVSGSNNK